MDMAKEEDGRLGEIVSGLKVDTGDNPKKREQKKEKKERNKYVHIRDEPSKTCRERIRWLLHYMKNSSLFCFPKRSIFRRKLMLLSLGGTTKPMFKSVDDLIDFYTQKIDQKKLDRFQHEMDPDYEDSGDSVKSEEDQ